MKSVSVLSSVCSRSLNMALAPLAAAGFMAATASVAHADIMTQYTYTNTGGISGATGPFGTVTVDDHGGGTYTVDVEVSPNNLIATGNTNHFALSFEASQGTISNVGGAAAGTSYSIFDNGTTSVDNDPFKGFDYAIQCSAGPTSGCGGSLTFTFSGALTTGAANVFLVQTGTDSVGTAIFASDIFCGLAQCSTLTGKTGVVGTGDGVPVPGPIVGAGLPGLIVACGGLLVLARRRQRKTA